MVQLSAVSQNQIDLLNRLRNEVMHSGGTDEKTFEYIDSILTVALPVLEEFYKKAYSLDLSDLIFDSVKRELEVAKTYLQLAQRDTTLPRPKTLTTFVHDFLHDKIIGQANLLFDERGRGLDLSEWQFERLNGIRSKAEDLGWNLMGENAYTACVICGEACLVSLWDEDPEYVDGEERIYAEAISCPNCGLLIEPTYKHLAKLHYGPITKERLGEEAWEHDVPR